MWPEPGTSSAQLVNDAVRSARPSIDTMNAQYDAFMQIVTAGHASTGALNTLEGAMRMLVDAGIVLTNEQLQALAELMSEAGIEARDLAPELQGVGEAAEKSAADMTGLVRCFQTCIRGRRQSVRRFRIRSSGR